MRIKKILAVYLLTSSVIFNSLCFTERQENVDARVLESVDTKIYSAATLRQMLPWQTKIIVNIP